jgi:HTH-type transcriptional regulator / antitoxin HigA
MDIKPIKTKADYRAVLKDIEVLMAAKRNTPEGDRLDVLATLVEAYERVHYPLDLPDAVAAIKFRMEQSGLKARDLQPIFGRLNRVYEVLNYKRALTMSMVWKLNRELGIPAEALIKQAAPAAKKRSKRHVVARRVPVKGGRKALSKLS